MADTPDEERKEILRACVCGIGAVIFAIRRANGAGLGAETDASVALDEAKVFVKECDKRGMLPK